MTSSQSGVYQGATDKEDKKEDPKKKKGHKTINLTVTAQRPRQLTAAQLNTLVEAEVRSNSLKCTMCCLANVRGQFSAV